MTPMVSFTLFLKIKFMLYRILFITLFASSVSTTSAQTPRIEFEAPELYPEGIAYDAGNDVFYVSSVYLGIIGKVDRSGKYTTILADSLLKSTFGMKIDTKKQMLWVCAGDPSHSKFKDSSTHKKVIRLIGIDLKSGKKVKDIDLSKLYVGKHFANDLTLDNSGNIYITDSYSPVIYKVNGNDQVSVFAQHELFGSIGTGLNGIVWHPDNYLIVGNNGAGCLLKVDVTNPQSVSKVKVNQFFPGLDGLLLDTDGKLVLVQNKEVNKVFQLESKDQWKSASVVGATKAEDRFYFPSTATFRGKEVWVVNAKLNEIAEPHKFLSKKFTLQQALFRPVGK
jgi:sugar lactone lactonase YvrE